MKVRCSSFKVCKNESCAHQKIHDVLEMDGDKKCSDVDTCRYAGEERAVYCGNIYTLMNDTPSKDPNILFMEERRSKRGHRSKNF